MAAKKRSYCKEADEEDSCDANVLRMRTTETSSSPLKSVNNRMDHLQQSSQLNGQMDNQMYGSNILHHQSQPLVQHHHQPHHQFFMNHPNGYQQAPAGVMSQFLPHHLSHNIFY